MTPELCLLAQEARFGILISNSSLTIINIFCINYHNFYPPLGSSIDSLKEFQQSGHIIIEFISVLNLQNDIWNCPLPQTPFALLTKVFIAVNNNLFKAVSFYSFDNGEVKFETNLKSEWKH